MHHGRRHKEVPPYLRPKLTKDQVRDLGLVHAINLDAIHTRTADEQILWDAVVTVLAWSRVAEVRHVGLPEIIPQVTLMQDIVDRYKLSGIVEFKDQSQYELARFGVGVMDRLAEFVDRQTAEEAVLWAMEKVSTERGVVYQAAA
jgi:hypothetical protein